MPTELEDIGRRINLHIRGDAKKLAEIHDEATAVELRMEATYCLEGYGVIVGYTGEALTNLFPQWLKLIAS